jgi:ABC-type spermidine/putrescine transport system permease subunit I
VWRALLPLTPLLAFLLVLFAWPVARVLWLAVPAPGSDGEPWRELLGTPLYRDVLLRTLRLSLTVTVACLLLGYPVAYAIARAPRRAARLLLVLVVVPFWISLLARSFTWMVLLQRHGVVNRLLVGLGLTGEPLPLVYNEVGVHIGLVHVLLPFMILSLYSATQSVDRALVRAAASLGATEWQTFRRVWWPLSRPGVAAGSVLLFVIALGTFVTPALLGGGKVTTMAMLIEANVSQAQNWSLAAALSVVLLFATALVLAPAQRVLGLDVALGTGPR